MLPDFLRRPEHPLTHNLAAVALRYSVRMGLAEADLRPYIHAEGTPTEHLLTVDRLAAWVAHEWALREAGE